MKRTRSNTVLLSPGAKGSHSLEQSGEARADMAQIREEHQLRLERMRGKRQANPSTAGRGANRHR